MVKAETKTTKATEAVALKRVLVADQISDRGLEILGEKLDVTYDPKITAEALLESIGEFDALLVTDDAHGLGVLPMDTPNPAPVQIGTLSKAVGSYGGYVCAARSVIDLLHSSARTLMFSTALPPATLAASVAALKEAVARLCCTTCVSSCASKR